MSSAPGGQPTPTPSPVWVDPAFVDFSGPIPRAPCLHAGQPFQTRENGYDVVVGSGRTLVALVESAKSKIAKAHPDGMDAWFCVKLVADPAAKQGNPSGNPPPSK